MTTNQTQSLHAVNGIGNGPHSLDAYTPEETLKQMEELIKENNELKEAIKQTNHAMKERYEELATWREKQREEREYIQKKFEEAKSKLMAVTAENEALKKMQPQNTQGMSKGDLFNAGVTPTLVEQDVQQLKGQIHRLQTEKADLVAMNSELLVKLGAASSEDSFVEIRMVEAMENAELKPKELECQGANSPANYKSKTHDSGEKCLSEELTVRQLLNLLRDKTLKLESLEHELQTYKERICELSKVPETADGATQSEESVGEPSSSDVNQESELMLVDVKEEDIEMTTSEKSPDEVEVLKSQVMALVKDLQEAQIKLDEAEDLKKILQERYLELEQKLAGDQVVLEEMKQLKYSNAKLKLQVESLQSEQKIEQLKFTEEKLKLAEEKRKLMQMQAAYDDMFKDCSSLTKTNEEMKTKESTHIESLNRLVTELDMVRRTKEENQKMIDQMAQTVFEQADMLKMQNAQNADLVDISAQLDMAEKALMEKQGKIDAMKQTIIKQEEEMETVAVFKAQADVYSADFHAERAAREAIHTEKQSLVERLDELMKENIQLKDELDTLGRQSLVELQRRHGGCGPVAENDAALQQQGAREPRNASWDPQAPLPEHACPKCGHILPDIDTLQIHVMDCII
ncbi:optineurin isoform X1 [Amblyraja radiata]|uniref:optineurin isoform X1 n=1 Tax=Amblyraja radiata TaxID=386614 RepID=UPI001402DBFA|nr:optineurin isoform X1 [Amblyraja radiata]